MSAHTKQCLLGYCGHEETSCRETAVMLDALDGTSSHIICDEPACKRPVEHVVPTTCPRCEVPVVAPLWCNSHRVAAIAYGLTLACGTCGGREPYVLYMRTSRTLFMGAGG